MLVTEPLDPAFIDLPERLLADYGTTPSRQRAVFNTSNSTATFARSSGSCRRAWYRWIVHGHTRAL